MHRWLTACHRGREINVGAKRARTQAPQIKSTRSQGRTLVDGAAKVVGVRNESPILTDIRLGRAGFAVASIPGLDWPCRSTRESRRPSLAARIVAVRRSKISVRL